MSFFSWGFAAAMLIVAISFVVVPLRSGKSLSASPKALIVAFIPLSALGLYAVLGSPDEITAPHADTRSTSSVETERPLGTVASMVDGLVARLENEPDDADGWVLLARSYEHLGRNADAQEAYEHAQALGKIDSELEASLRGDNASGSSLRGRVALSAAATAQVQPGDTLFIFAKTSREERMPVVALRRHASELPFEFTLTDKEIMVPGGKLSDYDQLVVTAKISRTGNASDNTLGLEAWSDSVSPSDNSRIDLLIGGIDD
jgi:hypothetical protein